MLKVIDIPVTEVKKWEKRHYVEYDMADPSLTIEQLDALRDDVEVDWFNRIITIRIS